MKRTLLGALSSRAGRIGVCLAILLAAGLLIARRVSPRPVALASKEAVDSKQSVEADVSPAPTAQEPALAGRAVSAQASSEAIAPAPPSIPTGNSPGQATVSVPVSEAASVPAAVPAGDDTRYPEDIGIDLSSDEARAQTVARIKAAEDANMALALKTAQEKGWPTNMFLEGGRELRLSGISKDGRPLYQGNHNAIAAISANVIPLRSTTYVPNGLRGEGWKVGVWESDGGLPLFTHPEFGNRVKKADQTQTDPTNLSTHATHVIGTIIASGVEPKARGMAPGASVDSYNAPGDLSEMTAVAATDGVLRADRIFISNHSYGAPFGWAIAGKDSGSIKKGDAIWSDDRGAGLYDGPASGWDTLAYQAPYYLPFKAAGNERGGKLPAGAKSFWKDGILETNLTKAPDDDGGRPGGYESTTSHSNAKNIMTVGNATDAVSQGSSIRNPSLAKPMSSSAWGPTDDGRIKPDLMANGEGLYSSSHTGTTNATPIYESLTGTSMASPSAAGAALLLQEYHHKLQGSAMRSARLKALLLHTADDLDATGPDYRTGWGLINAEAAANLLKSDAESPGDRHLYDSYLADAEPGVFLLGPTIESQSLTFEAAGSSALKATLVWTDPPGVVTGTKDDRGSRLVNDLDLRLISPSGQTIYPWVLDPEHPADPAGRGDNVRDNVEQIVVSAPEAGTYTLIISRKGIIRRYDPLAFAFGGTNNLVTYGQQPYSLVLSGNGPVRLFQEGFDDAARPWNFNGDLWTVNTSRNSISVDDRCGVETIPHSVLECRLSSTARLSYFETIADGTNQISWSWSITGTNGSGTSPVLVATVDNREVARLDRALPLVLLPLSDSGEMIPTYRAVVLDLPPGRHVVRWMFTAGNIDPSGFFASIHKIRIKAPSIRSPHGGKPWSATNRIEAEDYDDGVIGQTFSDEDTYSYGKGVRCGGLDNRKTSDIDGNLEIFKTSDGEWMEFTTDFPLSGLYSLDLRVAAASPGSILKVGSREIALPATGGDNKWQTVTVKGFIRLNGVYPMRLEWVKGGASLNWMHWRLEPWPERRALATTNNPAGLPWNLVPTNGTIVRIQAEDFDTGGESIAYHDTDDANSGGQYRLDESVDIKASDDPDDPSGFQVTQFNPGEYLTYSVNVPEFDSYDVKVRIRPISAQRFTFASGTVEVDFGGAGGNDQVRMSFNGTTNDWITLTGRLTEVLRGGNQTVTLRFPNGMAEVNWIEFSRVPPIGISRLVYLDRPGFLLNDFYPQPRGKGLFPKGHEPFSHPKIEMFKQSGRLHTFFETLRDAADNYGVILAGYVVPSVSGDYTFYISSADQGELWLSTDERPGNSRAIATEPEGNGFRAWTGTTRRPLVNGRPSNVSEPINLIAGKRYYVEAVMKDGTFSDHLAVAWRRPGQPAIRDLDEPISAEFLRPLETLPKYQVHATWAQAAPITYGTPLGTNQLNMVVQTFTQAGTIVYDPPAGTILPVGRHTLSAEFVPNPENVVSFAQIKFSTLLAVNPAPLVIQANDAQREAGGPNPPFTATFIGLMNGDTPGHLQYGVQFQTDAAPGSAPGTYPITPYGASGPNYLTTFRPGLLTVTPAQQRPFSVETVENPSALPVPGRIEAEAFDLGGEGRAYHDTDPGNNGGRLRLTEGVDLEQTTDTGGGFDIGWTVVGEWQEYTINVAQSGDYNLTLRVAQAGSGATVRVRINSQIVANAIALPDTGGVQSWANVTKWRIPLSGGTHVMRIEWLEGGGNLNWIEWQPVPDDLPRPLVQWPFNGDYTDTLLSRNLVGGFWGGVDILPELVDDSPSGGATDQSVRFTSATFAHLPVVEETQPLDLEGRGYTVEAWVKPVRPRSGKSVLAAWGRPGEGGWSTWTDANGNLGASSYERGDSSSTANVPDDGQWHHVAVAHQLGAQIHFFVDGQLKQTVAQTQGVAPTPDHTLHIGYELAGGAPSNPFVGQMDRLRISSGALEASQLDYPAVRTGEQNRGLNRLVYRYTPGVNLDDFYPTPRGQAFLPRGWEPTGPASTQSGRVENFEASANIDEHYGQVLFGYIVPTETSDYTFYLSSDDQGELWLSTDENSVNARLIASEPERNESRNWTGVDRRPLSDGRRSNVSTPIRLEAGKYYYVEAAMKEGTGADNLGVAWQRVGSPAPANGSAPIGGEHLRTVLLQAPPLPVVSTIDLIVNGSFEKPQLSNINENNIGTIPTGWSQTGPDETWNMVRNDGTPYASGVNTAKDGSQILDIAGPSEIFQNFTLSEASTVSFGASFANREGHDGSAPSTVGIYNVAGSTLLSSLVIVDTSADPTPSVQWRSGAATVDLPSGQYQIRIALNDFNNVDAVFARTLPSSNADLAGLVPSTGALNPVFASGSLAYTVSVPNGTSSLMLTPTAAQANATIRVNGTIVASGAASGSIALNVGSNPITVAVTAQDGVTGNSYVVTVTRAANAIARDLIVNGSFELPSLNNVNENNIGIIPTGWSQTLLDDTWNPVRNDGTPYGSGVSTAKEGSQILDIAGPSEIFQNFTLAEASTVSFGASFANREGHDGSAPSTIGIYNIAGNTLLSSLVTVDTSADPTPSVEWRSGAATVDLPAGQYQLRIALNDFNNVDAVFARTASTLPSGNADLAGLVPSTGALSPLFASGTLAYTVSVPNGTSSLTLTPTAAQANAAIRVNGTIVASGAASGAIALNVGSNPITIAVTAQDGVTVKSYVVTVTRAASAGATDLIVNGSFEEPGLNNINENNIGTIPTGWSQTGLDDTWNMVRNDGTPYGSGVDTAKDGSQILDIAGAFEIFQNFTLAEASTVSFGASFANREGHDGSAPSTVGIYNLNGSTLLSSLVTVDTSADPTPSVEWRSGAATVDLPAGQYQIRIALNDFNNVDAVFAVTLSPAAANPRLTISQFGAGLVVVWETAAGFLLERTDRLAPGATWTSVPFTTLGNTSSAPVGSGPFSKLFFRLRKQ